MFKEIDARVLSKIKEIIGKPYKYNCFDLSGFDCYTLVYYIYSLIGIELPKENIAKYNLRQHNKLIKENLYKFTPYKFCDRKPFDLLIFESAPKIDAHLGVVLNKDFFIHIDREITVSIEHFFPNIITASLKKVLRWNS